MALYSFADLEPYQVEGIKFGVFNPVSGLIIDTGLGKTIMSLTIFDQAYKRGLTRGALVVAPKTVMYNVWRQEAALWEHTRKYPFSIIHGEAGRGDAELVRRRALLTKGPIWLTSYDTLPWLTEALFRVFYRKPWPFDSVFYDESTFLKHSTTERFRYWKNCMLRFKRRHILTGSPIPNGYIDWFGQIYALDGGRRLGESKTSYQRTYFRNATGDNMRAKWVPIQGRITERAIDKKISPLLFVLKKRDWLTLPPVKMNPIMLDLPDALRKQYLELENLFITEINGETFRVTSASAASTKLRQFLSGRMYNPVEYDQEGRPKPKTVTPLLHSVRLDMIKAIREGLDGQVIVAFNFRFEAEDLRKVFPKAAVLQGGEKSESVQQMVRAWSELRLSEFLINPAASAHGLNLQRGGHHIVWFSGTWNQEHYQQLNDRLDRRHQTKTVFIHHLLFRDTIDEVVFEARQKKYTTQELFFSFNKFFKERRK